MNKKELKILCAGAYGIENAGDDLPLINLCAELGRLLPDHTLDFRVLSRHPDQVEAESYGVTMIQNPEYASGAAAMGRWFRGLNPGDDPEILASLRQEIRQADLLVLGAGNALIDQTIDVLRGPVPLLSLYGFLAALYQTPLMIYGMSVGPLKTAWGRDLSRGLLASARIITVRDQASVDLIGDIFAEESRPVPQIHLLPDPALAATVPGVGRGEKILAEENLVVPPDKILIAVGLRDLARPLDEEIGVQLEDSVVGMMDELSEEAAFLLIPQSTYGEDDDRLLARRLIKRTRARCLLVQKRLHPAHLIALYGLARVTLAGRLHAAVFSVLAGVPVVGIDYLPKVGGFLEQLGTGARTVAVGTLSAEVLVEELRCLLGLADPQRKELARRVEALSRQAGQYAQLAVQQGLDLGIDEH